MVVGDTHGAVHDVRSIFQQQGYPGFLSGSIPKLTTYVFMGDYLDRGPHQLALLLALLCFKLANNRSIHLLRGNHETPDCGQYRDFIANTDSLFVLLARVSPVLSLIRSF